MCRAQYSRPPIRSRPIQNLSKGETSGCSGGVYLITFHQWLEHSHEIMGDLGSVSPSARHGERKPLFKSYLLREKGRVLATELWDGLIYASLSLLLKLLHFG